MLRLSVRGHIFKARSMAMRVVENVGVVHRHAPVMRSGRATEAIGASRAEIPATGR